MKINRRHFLQNLGIASTSPMILSTLNSCNSNKSESKNENDFIGKGIEKFGLQIWTVKEDMAKDPKSTLKAISDAGYKQIESFTGEKGIFWGYTPSDFKKYLDDLGLEIISSHINPDFTSKKETEEEFKKLVDEAASVGIKHLINPFPGEIKTSEDWKIVTEGLNRQGLITKAAGLKTGYHNHHFEFLPLENGSLPEKIMLEGTNAELVDFELDLYWIVKAGQDPYKWFNDYKNRFKLVHIKDLYKEDKVKEIEATEKSDSNFWPLGASTIIGTGRIDFPKLLSAANTSGVENFIVEQERFDNTTPLQAIVNDAEYMKAFKFA